MANFCNQFDKLSTALDCAVIYCHHHSKGTQGQKKSSDRSSGSGVFARDPDAILDLLPLQISDELEEEIVNKEIKDHLIKEVTIKYPDFKDYMTSEQSLTVLGVTEAVDTYLEGDTTLSTQLKFEARKKAEAITAWRIEATLREFPQFKPKDVFFKYPVHEEDKDDLLKDALVEGELPPKLTRKPKTEAKRREDQIAKELDREEKNFEKEQERKRRLAEKEQEQEKKLAEKEQETKVLLNKYNEAFEELENINEDLTITNLSNILGSNRSQVDRKLKNELSPYFECHKGGLVERRIF
jgi:RecA-family ATPase